MSIPGILATSVGAVVAAGSGSGGGSGSVSVTDQTLNAFGVGTQLITYQATTSGLIRRGKNGAYSTLETWLLSGSVTDYEIRFTVTSGDALTGGSASATWLGFGATREWELEEITSGGALTSNCTVELRLAAPPNTVLDTATVQLNVLVF